MKIVIALLMSALIVAAPVTVMVIVTQKSQNVTVSVMVNKLLLSILFV